MNQGEPVAVSQSFKDATNRFVELKSEIDRKSKKLSDMRKELKELNTVIITEMENMNLLDFPIHIPNSDKKIRAKQKVTVKPLNNSSMVEFFTQKMGSEETAKQTIDDLMKCRKKETTRVLEMCNK